MYLPQVWYIKKKDYNLKAYTKITDIIFLLAKLSE